VIGDRWGVREDEVARHYPCDDFVRTTVLSVWRGVTVSAPPADVWPWVAQIRTAPYSYDFVDNLGRRSPQRLLALPDPVVGEPFTAVGGRRIGRILSVDVGTQLTGSIAGFVISYLLVPEGDETRLLMKIVGSGGRRLAPLLSLGDLIMARRQLLNLKRLAEAGQRAIRRDPGRWPSG
jgi:hypothetical protein